MQYTIDARGKKLGRMASQIAVILQGKKSPAYEPRLPGGDRVVVQHIDQASIAEEKKRGKRYYRHTTQIGHLKERTLGMLLEKHGPAYVLRKMVSGMLPKNRLRAMRIKRLVIE